MRWDAGNTNEGKFNGGKTVAEFGIFGIRVDGSEEEYPDPGDDADD